MAEKMHTLFEQVFQNPLILGIICCHMSLKNLYLLKQVSRIWKDAADTTLRKRFILRIDLTTEDWIEKSITDLKYFDALNLSKLHLRWSKQMRKTPLTAYHISKHGEQIKTLEIDSMELKSEKDFKALEILLKSMPNLQKLTLQPDIINLRLLLKFNPKVSINFVEVNASNLDVKEEKDEAIVSQVLRIFENLSTNFDETVLDRCLLTHLSKRKKPMIFFHELCFKIKPEESYQTISLLDTVNPAILPNLKNVFICFAMPTESFGISLRKGLANFSQSLEEVTLNCTTSETEWKGNKVLLSLPPLKKLRTLELGIPPIIEGTPAFLWDLGKQLAKDFPILEELKLDNEKWEDKCTGFAFEKYKYPEAWCIWEPFVPILRKYSVDISPFKALRTAEFCLPPQWLQLLEDGGITWGKSFLEVCHKLYPEMSHDENIICQIDLIKDFLEEREDLG